MLNLTGPQFDLANVVHAVLADCEHRRRASSGELGPSMEESARKKLAAARSAYDEFHGDAAYWDSIEHEVMHTALPQYVQIAERQNRLERTFYGVWRGGDVTARVAFALLGLTIGGLIIAAPFIPIFIDAFAFALAFSGWFYPDVKKLTHDWGYIRRMNAIVREAAEYQRRNAMEYLTSGSLDKAFKS